MSQESSSVIDDPIEDPAQCVYTHNTWRTGDSGGDETRDGVVVCNVGMFTDAIRSRGPQCKSIGGVNWFEGMRLKSRQKLRNRLVRFVAACGETNRVV
jgi:hypothetical protein